MGYFTAPCEVIWKKDERAFWGKQMYLYRWGRMGHNTTLGTPASTERREEMVPLLAHNDFVNGGSQKDSYEGCLVCCSQIAWQVEQDVWRCWIHDYNISREMVITSWMTSRASNHCWEMRSYTSIAVWQWQNSNIVEFEKRKDSCHRQQWWIPLLCLWLELSWLASSWQGLIL